MKKIVVLAAESGNVHSVVRALHHVGADVELTADPDAVMAADGLVVPGVGAFAAVMDKLRAVKADRLIERRLAGGRGVLGICVGLQVMFEQGTEYGVHEGFAQWPGSVDLLPAAIVPHMGWSLVDAPADSQLFNSIADERFYFVHSYGVQSDPAAALPRHPHIEPPLVTFAEHGARFVAAVENGPLMATQFHPEKSGDAGAQLLTNWIATL
ncbi:MAG: imidazole glycerol phosphate synthase subunit HisH [Ancrocorticia sp.]|uniref:imidazole glycerol phosphate synthase subunit HisH n=1 Tax=Ancrocorticia sp. TaxID=2593684 RepID=UPI003F8DBE49